MDVSSSLVSSVVGTSDVIFDFVVISIVVSREVFASCFLPISNVVISSDVVFSNVAITNVVVSCDVPFSNVIVSNAVVSVVGTRTGDVSGTGDTFDDNVISSTAVVSCSVNIPTLNNKTVTRIYDLVTQIYEVVSYLYKLRSRICKIIISTCLISK